MEITRVTSYSVWIGHRAHLLVKVETDAGIHGWGESGLSSRERAVAGAIEHYAEFLIGRDPTRVASLWQEMYRSQYFEGGRVLTAAISAIDIALSGYPLDRTGAGQALLQGRFAGGRSRLGGCPHPARPAGGCAFGLGFTMSSW